jgi:RNA ligase
MSDISSAHPARAMTFAELREGLAEAVAARTVSEQRGADGLALYCYTKSAVYDRAWTPFTTLARGLVLDLDAERVVATPFPKFFNVGEREGDYLPSMPFETFEKLDGSLIVIFWHAGDWRTATKGSLGSDQAAWAARYLADCDLSALRPGTTYLAEAIYPENRIVIRYDEAGLYLLAAYDEGGHEMGYDTLSELADALGWPIAKRHAYDSVAALIEHARTLPATEEGFVLRFANGLRLKVKGDEYRRIHSMVSRVTPLAVWESMLAGDDLTSMRKDLPEEFWADFDSITAILNRNVEGVLSQVRETAQTVADLSDKDVGLRLAQFPDPVRSLIFPFRKAGGDLLGNARSKQVVFRHIRPTRNELAGYAPSSSVARLQEEAA